MTDPRKVALLEKYRAAVERSVRRTKNCASHMHTRRMALAAISGDLAPFWANELCTYLIKGETAAIIEKIFTKYGIAN